MSEEKEKIIVKGFLLDFWLPTEDLLNITIDVSNIPRSSYMDFKEGLEDLLTEIDQEYAKRRTRGRGLRARYVTVVEEGRKVRKRVLRLSPYPSSFLNVFKTIRMEWYEALFANTIILSKAYETGLGYARGRNIYLLPIERAPNLMLEKERLDERIASLIEEMKEYEKSDYFKQVIDYIFNALGIKMPIENVSLRSAVHPIRIRMYHVRLEPEIIEEYISEEVEEERRRALESVMKEVERTRVELIERAVMDVQRKVSDILRLLTIEAGLKLSSRTAKRIKRGLENLKDLAKSAGVGYLVSDLTDSSLDLIEAMEKEDKKKIVSIANSLAKDFGIKPSKDPSDTLRDVSTMLLKEVPLRVKLLMREVI